LQIESLNYEIRSFAINSINKEVFHPVIIVGSDIYGSIISRSFRKPSSLACHRKSTPIDLSFL